MKLKWHFTIFLIFLFSLNLKAQSENILEMSNGACWLSFSKDQIKLAAFNEKTSISKSFEQLNTEAFEYILGQNFLSQDVVAKNLSLGVHCGGYGASLVFKIETNNGDYCFWSKFNNGKLELRSFGVASVNGDVCIGRKMGEVLIGVSDQAVVDQLRSDTYKSYIEKIDVISKSTAKLVVKKEFNLKEDEVIEKLKNDFLKDQIRYYEFNEFRHPVGEYIQIYK